ncbi:hypothetical protein CRM22_001953 [Opisthorchis felineus]|uniref:Deleted in lung and esophageal cancer protein 1 Ig-like domain-containing protein n=1 Tax=Opisthorchis felineus TaxID=147828 RepID=A0A4S2MEA1_OPIFE|nr:hypothetical protein CRM22_001953 [Opisthorchis felineus]
MKYKPRISEQMALKEELKRIQSTQNYPKNPRHKEQTSVDATTDSFVADPKTVCFTSYCVGALYKMDIRVKNVTTISHSLRVLPPKTNYFSLSKIQFPTEENNFVAPGMACILTIQFAPDTLGDYEDEVLIEQDAHPQALVIPILARRTRLDLTLLELYSFGSCLVGSKKTIHVSLELKNKEADASGRFIIMSPESYSAYEILGLRNFEEQFTTVEQSNSLEADAFSLTPACFHLTVNAKVKIDLCFNPVNLGPYETELVLICDNGMHRKFRLKGVGEEARVVLHSFGEFIPDSEPGRLRTLSSDGKNSVYTCWLSKQYVHTIEVTELVIENLCHTSIQYQWVHMQRIPERRSAKVSCTGKEETADPSRVFRIKPNKGCLEPKGVTTFQLITAPAEIGESNETFRMILKDVPQVLPDTQVPFCSDLQPIELDLAVEGIPVPVSLEPCIVVIPGSTEPGLPVHRRLKLVNKSINCSVRFNWEPNEPFEHLAAVSSPTKQLTGEDTRSIPVSHALVEFEPLSGIVPPGQTIDVKLRITSEGAGFCCKSFPCQIDKLPNSPLWVRVEANFEFPSLLVEDVDCDFGVLRVDSTVTRSVTITNPGSQARHWSVGVDVHDSLPAVEIYVEQSEGIIEPFTSASVQLRAKAACVGVFRGILQLRTMNDQKMVEIPLSAAVQSTQLDLQPNHISVNKMYCGVANWTTIKLVNLTRLETKFEWLPAEGKDVDWISETVNPSSGTIEGLQSMDIKLTFLASKQGNIEHLIIPCRVEGMSGMLQCSVCGSVNGLAINVRHVDTCDIKINTIGSESDCSVLSSSAMPDQIIVGPTINQRPNLRLCSPVELWIEVVNLTPIPAQIEASALSLGLAEDLKIPPNCTPKIRLSGECQKTKEGSTLFGRNTWAVEKTERRLLYEWCQAVMNGSEGARLFVVASIMAVEGTQSEVNIPKTIVHSNPEWTLPPLGKLCIGFAIVADLWGEYNDIIQVRARSVQLMPNNPDPPPIHLPISFSVNDCPILLPVASTFGQVTNKIGRSLHPLERDILESTEEPITAAFADGASQCTLRLGSYLVGSAVATKMVKLYNSSSSPIQIDWQIYLNQGKHNVNDLIELLCFTNPCFEPLSGENETNPVRSESLSDTNTVGENSDLLGIVIRPREGELIWQSSSAQVLSCHTQEFKSILKITPAQVTVGAHEHCFVTIAFDPVQASHLLMGDESHISISAHALGYLRVSRPCRKDKNVRRPLTFLAPPVRLDITALLERPRLLFDWEDEGVLASANDDSQPQYVTFHVNVGEILTLDLNNSGNGMRRLTFAKQNISSQPSPEMSGVARNNAFYAYDNVIYSRPVQIRSLNQAPVHVQLHVSTSGTKTFGFISNDEKKTLSKAEVKSKLKGTKTFVLQPHLTKRVNVVFVLSSEDICSLLGKCEQKWEDNRFIKHGGILVVASPTASGAPNPEFCVRHEILLEAKIFRPQLQLYPNELLDFGTMCVGDTRKREIRIINQTQMNACWFLCLQNSPESDCNFEYTDCSADSSDEMTSKSFPNFFKLI